MHVYLHLLSKFLHVHVNMYVWSKLSRCFVFSQQPVKMFRLLSGDQGWGRLQRHDYNYDYDYTMITKNDYDYSQRKLIMIMITNP